MFYHLCWILGSVLMIVAYGIRGMWLDVWIWACGFFYGLTNILEGRTR